MVVDDEAALVEALRDLAGDSIRVVATYDRDGYDPAYVRPDAEPRVEVHAERVHDELVLQGLGRGHLEDLFGAGDLQCSVHRFDDLTAFHFAAAEFTGLFVSVDSDADLPLATFSETCKSHVRDAAGDPSESG
ncbi:hypothetical protein [Halosimplex salinum]|uniref:hypothetical protein n=1 Tax=Halosimplex salinum TaxID=1710538 RepID=UPI001F43294C|nr:hypothetical protein [Halosimplex salinum]